MKYHLYLFLHLHLTVQGLVEYPFQLLLAAVEVQLDRLQKQLLLHPERRRYCYYFQLDSNAVRAILPFRPHVTYFHHRR